MLNIKTQSHFADAIASILRAQLRASSDALAASLRCWSTWMQMLTAGRAADEDPMPAHSQWVWSMPWSMPWSMSWPMHWPMPGPWQGGSCDAARLRFVLLGPLWWAAPGGGLRAPLFDPSLGQSLAGWVLPHGRLNQPILVPATAAYTATGPGSNPGSDPGVNRDSVDASFARYR